MYPVLTVFQAKKVQATPVVKITIGGEGRNEETRKWPKTSTRSIADPTHRAAVHPDD
jgi:hypothetical protein